MAVNNTRSITAGSQIAGQTVGKEVRRYEYRSSGMSDARMKVVRNAVYRKMLTYPAEDLVNIITQYGDASEIKPGSDKDLLAQLATEVLIINMDPNELKAIVDSVQTAENNLRNDIHQIEKKSKRNLSNHLTKHKNDKFERKITKENNKRIEKMAKDLKVHKSVRRGLPKLRNELNKVLDDFTNMQIQYYAQRMGIEIYDGIPIKEIKKAIVDNVVTYALVVQNKLSISFGTALQDPSACEELLGYTPYYYLNGNPNAYAPGEWMVKREAAKIAKASADERNRLAGKKRVSKKAIRNITGGAETAKDIKAGDTGPLAEMNETQILTLAGEYGIIVDKKSKVEDIKLQIYKKMAIQNKRIKKLQKQADKGGFYNDANSKLAVHSAITGLLDNTAVSGGTVGGVPVISVNKDGITSLEVDRAVPVVVVGYGAGGSQKVGYAKDAKKQRENLALGILGKTQKVKLTDLSDMELNMYYDMKSASDPRARMTAYRRNKYSVDDTERQKVYAMFNDDSWGALYILSYMYGYTKLRAYIEQETGISVRVATRRKFIVGGISSIFKGPKEGKSKATADPNTLNGRSKANWDIIKDMKADQKLTIIQDACRGTIDGTEIDALRSNDAAMNILVAIAIKDKTLATTLQNYYAKNGITVGKIEDIIESKMFRFRKKMSKTFALAGRSIVNENAAASSSITGIAGALIGENDEARKGTGSTEEEKKQYAPVYGINAAGEKIKQPYRHKFEVRGSYALPVFIANKYKGDRQNNGVFGELITRLENIQNNTSDTVSKLGTIITGFTIPAVFTGMGVGAFEFPGFTAGTIKEAVVEGAKTGISTTYSTLTNFSGGSSTTAATGAKQISVRHTPKLATGGSMTNSVITGDAMSSNIFKNGAKPELVSSNGDMSVTPLNKAGAGKQKVSRMTSTERSQALATSLSSHIVKFDYKLPNAVEVSNAGEAIKVYNVKPGITDMITAGGIETTLADLVANIYNSLVTLVANEATSNELLTAIAAKPSAVATSGTSENPFGGFPSSFDNILGGE